MDLGASPSSKPAPSERVQSHPGQAIDLFPRYTGSTIPPDLCLFRIQCQFIGLHLVQHSIQALFWSFKNKLTCNYCRAAPKETVFNHCLLPEVADLWLCTHAPQTACTRKVRTDNSREKRKIKRHKMSDAVGLN